MKLIDQLVQLGEEKPQLQEYLRPILDDLLDKGQKSLTWYESSPQEAPDKAVEPPGHAHEPVHDPEEEGFFVGPKARQAFEEVLLPQIKAKLNSQAFDKIYQMMHAIEALGTNQDIDLENNLIVYKPVSMNTERFYTEVQEAFKDWVLPKLSGGAPSSSGDGEGKKEYNFNFQ